MLNIPTVYYPTMTMLKDWVEPVLTPAFASVPVFDENDNLLVVQQVFMWLPMVAGFLVPAAHSGLWKAPKHQPKHKDHFINSVLYFCLDVIHSNAEWTSKEAKSWI